ncbi:MAG: RnfABCDGE type electron transport complex subunit D [Bacteroidetes bacterium]|nr:RnfABCDGE type electron transport complex subunit D [Bacteroidota bacterium]MCB0851752.1 RnfABCDGE type electron transport complex subunit D [Bacteroidota bacterium]
MQTDIPESQSSRSRFWLTRDARHFQIAYLGGFLVYGILALGWEAEWMRYLTIIVACLVTQVVAVRLTTRNYSSIKSGLITALGLCLLFKANGFATLAFASVLAISSKFLIRFNDKHLFNPANFGIILTILLTGDAWVSPGQWGSNVILLFMMGAAGLIVLLKVGRIDTSIAFLASFGGLLFIQNVLYKGWPMDHLLHSLTSGTLLLFAFFMITDPVTTPDAPKARIIWAALVGLVTFMMTAFFDVFDAPIWALFLVTPLTVFLDKHLKHQKFSW